MKNKLPMFAALAISLMSGVFASSLQASEWDRKTIITISTAVTVEGTTLAAGKYMLRLQDSDSSRNIVNVFNADGTRLITTVLAIHAYRLQPVDKNEFLFDNSFGGQPALYVWFYQGNNDGLEFPRPAHTAAAESSAGGN